MSGFFNSMIQEKNLRLAIKEMARAKSGRVSPDILYKDLCYDAQQAVEKAFKSVCIIHEIVFPKTHDTAYLIELLEKGGVEVPINLQNGNIINFCFDVLCATQNTNYTNWIKPDIEGINLEL